MITKSMKVVATKVTFHSAAAVDVSKVCHTSCRKRISIDIDSANVALKM